MSDFEENNSIENSCKTSDDHRISETNNCLQYIKDLEIKVNKIENYINMIRQKRRNRFFYQLRQKKKKSQKPKFRKFWRKIEKKRKFQKLEFEEIFVPDEQDEEISNIDAPDKQDNKRERIFNFEFAEHFTEFVIDPQKSLQENEKLAEFEKLYLFSTFEILDDTPQALRPRMGHPPATRSPPIDEGISTLGC